MRINTRFTAAVHMLALLALNKNEVRLSTSELLAKSVGTNPVVICIKKVGEAFAKATAGEVILHDLGKMMREAQKAQETAVSAEPAALVEAAADTELVVVAAPVFGGRLPSAAAEYLKTLKGSGKCGVCEAACPTGSRILPPPMQDAMNQKLGVLKDVRRENETFL